MNSRRSPRRSSLLLTVAAIAQLSAGLTLADAPKPAIPAITGGAPKGVAAVGETVTWTIERPAALPADGLHFRLMESNAKLIKEGDLPPDKPTLTVDGKLDKPGWLYLEITQKTDTKPKLLASAGAIVAPEQLKQSTPRPDDFNDFWKAQIEQIKKVPADPHVKVVDSGKPGVQLFEVLLANVDGSYVHAQLARPEKGDKFPAMVLYQYAGLYPLQKQFATGYASQGYVVLNVLAHDLPIYEDKSFYEKQASGDLKNYTSIGATSRDTSYFRKMFLGDYQAIEYVMSRPDWNGRDVVVRGESQGGMQSFAMAGLHPKVTAMIASVPAGSDPHSARLGRAAGWPYWSGMQPAASRDAIMETARYYDPANFAQNITCPAFVSVGLRDVTAVPTNVIAAFNNVKGPRELVIMPLASHTGAHEPSVAGVTRWLTQIKKGLPPVEAAK